VSSKKENYRKRLGCKIIIDLVNERELRDLYRSERRRGSSAKLGQTDPFLLTQYQYEGVWED